MSILYVRDAKGGLYLMKKNVVLVLGKLGIKSRNVEYVS